MRLDAKFVSNVVESLVQALVHARGTADVHFSDFVFVRHQIALDKVLIPHFSSEAVPTLTNANGQFEISFTELAIDLLQGFTYVQANLAVHAKHRHVEEQGKVISQLVHFFWHFRLVLFKVLIVGPEQHV